MRRRELVVNESQAGRSVKSVLKNELGMSESYIRRIKQLEGGIMLNNQRAFTTATVALGDVLSAVIGSELQTTGVLPFPILFEDEDILIFNKPAGICVHASRHSPNQPTIDKAVISYLGKNAAFHPVSRLDKGTTGIMTIAKNGYIHELLRRRLHSDFFRREYIGIACGIVSPPLGRIELAIGRDEDSFIRRKIITNASCAVTEYSTIATYNNFMTASLSATNDEKSFTVLRLVPQTGRTHQLRLHLSAIGHPLVGDWLYGNEENDVICRPALHSHRLIFLHPVTHRMHELTCEPPNDMQLLIKKANRI